MYYNHREAVPYFGMVNTIIIIKEIKMFTNDIYAVRNLMADSLAGKKGSGLPYNKGIDDLLRATKLNTPNDSINVPDRVKQALEELKDIKIEKDALDIAIAAAEKKLDEDANDLPESERCDFINRTKPLIPDMALYKLKSDKYEELLKAAEEGASSAEKDAALININNQ